ncbi:YciI family protein [Kaistia nematophila]|uniref:YciI family protein n=1 Tax=Kaistia nematophila TaxID=2994654 RepID=A0A9X3IIT9_9HYPH|nr:YciI family protein [Kaistia nematophila]MCX5567829.1 YciI family protein [Kaistia nematophila]
MQFACLVYVDGDAMAALSSEEQAQLTDETIAQDWALRQAGRLILARPLQAPTTAAIVRVRAGRATVTDGPFAEAKEMLGGFLIIEADDRDQAIAVAKASPMARMGSIEVRPILVQTHSVTGEGRPPALSPAG